MRDDDVALGVVARLVGDTQLTTLLDGPHIYRSGANRTPRLRSVEWLIISAPDRENTQQVMMQFDVWARTYAEAVAIGRRIHALLHREVPDMLGGLLMFMRYLDTQDLPDAEPGVVHRSHDYLFEPAREMA